MTPDTDRPTLTAEDRAALRPRASDNGWTVNGRTILLRDVLNAWADAEERAMHATATPDLDARVAEFLDSNLPTDSNTLRTAVGTLRAQEAKGRAKYGTDLDGANLSARQVLAHATEEAADLLMYLTALKSHAALDQEIARDWETCYRGACSDRDALRARVAELEAEVARLRAFDLIAWQTSGTGSGDLRGQGLQP